MRVLIVVHGFPPRAQGGAEIYAHAQAVALARGGDDVLVLTREQDTTRPEYVVRRERRDGLEIAWINNTFAQSQSFADTYRNDRIGAVAAAIIDGFTPDVAHAHHLTCLSTTIVDELWLRGVPVLYTLHDYWLICHRGQLLDLDLRVCAGPEAGGCERCLGAAGSAPAAAFAARSWAGHIVRRLPAAIANPLQAAARRVVARTAAPEQSREASEARLQHMRELTTRISHFLAPSRFMRDRFVAFGVDPAKITVSEYGCDGSAVGRPSSDVGRPFRASSPLRLGFLGSLMVSKAPHVLLEACEGLPAGAVTVDLFGEPVDYHGDDRYRSRLAPLLDRPWVRVHDKLPHDGVDMAYAQIDALVVPSIWLENSPLVIREAFLAGVPVVASRTGGIPETVTDNVNGLLFTPGDVEDLRRALRRLIDEPDLLPRLARGIPAVRTLADDVSATRQRYVDAVSRTAATTRLAAVVLNYRAPDDTFLAVRSLLLSHRPIDDVIVVDNDASDACQQALAPIAARVTYLRTGRNLGFSGGMNVGIREAMARGADRVLLVNSDVIVPADSVASLERALDAAPHAGIAGPAVMARHAPDRVASLGMSYRRDTGRMRHRGVGLRLPDASGPAITDVEGVSGCFMLISRRVLDATGLLDEDYFFGFEDLDFCLRARDAGFRTIVSRAATVLHEGGRSMGADAPQRFYYGARNQLLMARRTSPDAGAIGSAGRAGVIVALNMAHAARARGGSLGARLSAAARGTRDYLRGRLGRDPRD